MYIFNKHKRHEVQKAIAAKCSLVFIHLYCHFQMVSTK